MKKILPLFFIATIILAACRGVNVTAAPEASATKVAEKTSTAELPVETVSGLEVQEEALKGLEITVWTPWYGIEADLFNSFVNEFNEQNEWGIKVNLQNQVNFANLYEKVTASLPTEARPDLVIALPEHAQGWYADGVATDLTDYIDDPIYGIDSGDIPYVFWNQDLAGEARVAFPAQRNAQFLLWNETWAGKLGFDSVPDTADVFREQACSARQS
ncbi:MAG: hypothetical protein C4586_03690, partial [Anaerolineaceae bacterium]